MRTFCQIFVMIMSILLWGCQSEPTPEAALSPAEQLERGKLLAQVHCVACHRYPEPGNLDLKTWRDHVLPRMGYFLGYYDSDSTRNNLIGEGPGGERVRKAQVFPEAPLLPAADWEAIQAYYLAEAPDSLSLPVYDKIAPVTPLFKARIPSARLSPPSVTMVRFSGDPGLMYVGDANTQAMYLFDQDLNLLRAAKTREGAVHLSESEDALVVTVMGSFSPTDAPSGLLLELPLAPGRRPRILIEGLQRPVHHAAGDLDGDGTDDYVISEFAKWTGSLSWWKQRDDGGLEKHMLRDETGPIRAYIEDLDQDGRQDVVALFGQGDEGIFAFFNQGAGAFREERLLHFPSSWGSSYFALFDYNGDGFQDIIYTCGDNADYPPILKPYHGIRIFQNDGKNNFAEVFFYPLNGAYNAIPADFDGDGDMDIAAISFFPDFQKRPEESFVFLENQGDGQFTASTIPEVNAGRWIVMDAGDPDRDGDLDLLLGSLAFEVVPPSPLLGEWVENGIGFLYLENQLK